MELFLWITVGLLAYLVLGLIIGIWLETIGAVRTVTSADLTAYFIFWPVFLLKAGTRFAQEVWWAFTNMLRK